MKIHFIGVGENIMHDLAFALKEEGYEITGSDNKLSELSETKQREFEISYGKLGWFPDKVVHGVDAVVVGIYTNTDNPELEKAKDLGLKIYSYQEFIYWFFRDKTRIVIAGSCRKTTIIHMVLHVLNFHGKSVNYVISTPPLESSDVMMKLSKESDFIILEGSNISYNPDYKPNIALISGIEQYGIEDHYYIINQFQEFVNSITAGGVIIYNKEKDEVAKIVENTNNYLRKIPYITPNHELINNELNLLTEMGKIPVSILYNHENLQSLEASRHMCQQLGIMEEEFYEAIISFNENN